MKKEYWYVIIAYIVMQLSSLVGVPIIAFIGAAMGKSLDEMQTLAIPYWLVISFSLTLLIILLILRKERTINADLREVSSPASSAAWAFAGVFLALFAQSIAGSIESMLGIEMGSENTQEIIKLIERFPVVILVSSIIGPILEEIVFRKIIFGSLHRKMNFFLAALISSVIFALAHMEPEHVILYSAMGFTFAFLYVKTKRIIVPIIAHVTMNTMVVLLQSVFREDIERMIKEAEKIQSFIGGF
ncbi:CPBP family intramembrane metalloprotease [Mesobacillus sp. AQ2]|uniref:CPBP family intramembrane glutamic endopeptidase n=1 Tax=Bacillaceae TaxID=186817 RepID=UPI0011AAAA22|nr:MULTISPECIES: CPBP family intramembrane glutamic endopeptidase [Bacillaceae]MCM3125844.1 CPBP family intramembrane metalloprotease [Mesobacillus sp. MER 33]MCM3235865.1 CPBP family intramembrane metalloprotease [Mesobacillus sp. MER 48]WHX40860.1 CPBP family intramembrane metalloprotease [Mesobacillus sp. AQ2]